MIDPTVRPAAPGDVDALVHLEADARAALVDRRGGARWLEEHPARGAAFAGAVEAGQVLVAHLGDVVVGYLVLVTSDDGVAVVDDVFVEPDAREVGFGDALLEVAVESARRSGARFLEGTALPGDRETKNLYERAGITARLIVVSVPLSDPSTGARASR